MAFNKGNTPANGLNYMSGNACPEDPQSNKGPTSGSKRIGVVKGRLTFSKQSVSSLNKGQETASGK
jgi:hypothetical protein